MPPTDHMAGLYILDDERIPVRPADLVTWVRWMDTHDRTVATDEVGSAVVSTVFVGIDRGGGGAAMLFETKVYGGRLNGRTVRCSTWGQAELQHHAMAQLLKHGPT